MFQWHLHCRKLRGKIPKRHQHHGLKHCLLTSERAPVELEPIQLVRSAGIFALLNLSVSERVKAYYQHIIYRSFLPGKK